MIKFFKREKHFKKKSGEVNIDLYWSFIFYTGFFLTLAAFAFGLYLFGRINKELILSADGISGQFQTIKKERIEKALEYFSLRKQKSSQILNSPAPVVDPSL